MKKVILLAICFIFMGCGTPSQYHERTNQVEKRFSEDPLLDSIMYYRYMDCLRNCSDKDCD